MRGRNSGKEGKKKMLEMETEAKEGQETDHVGKSQTTGVRKLANSRRNRG